MKDTTLSDWLSWQSDLHSQTIDMGLERIQPVYRQLIQAPIAKKIVIVGGTNGKGSTVAFLESMYVAAGYKVGTYTSPHLIDYNERIRLQGDPVDDNAICEAFDHVENARKNISLTYFEFGTLAAFDIFQRHDLDIVILEVGLGGRLDAVNLVDADVSVITNIQLDHISWLGTTREQIAIEKLGIARQQKPLIFADDDIPENFSEYIEQNELHCLQLGKHFGFTFQDNIWHWWGLIDESQQKKHSLPVPGLRGKHQFKNASAALTVAALLANELPLSMSHMRLGLETATLPGRFQGEQIDGKTVIFDVAHNPHSMQLLVENLRSMPKFGDCYVIIAMLNDKAVSQVVQTLKPMIDKWILPEIEADRAMSVNKMYEALLAENISEASIIRVANVKQACKEALNKMQDNDKLLVTGSFYTVADALTASAEISGSLKQ